MNFKASPLMIAAAGVAAYLLLSKRGLDLDMADVKPSGQSFLTVVAMSIVGIVTAKYLTERFYVPGLTELVAKV